ncbi:MAG: SRPBCC family protein [Bacteroidota bacterium]
MRVPTLILMIFSILQASAQDQSQSNKHFWHTIETEASPENIWSIWTDVPNWKQWDTGLQDAIMLDEFALNAKGIITSLENRKSKFKIVEFVDGKSYTMKTKLPLGSLYVRRFLTVQDGKTSFTHEVWFQGLTGGIFAKAFGPKFRSMLPEVLQRIDQISKEK